MQVHDILPPDAPAVHRELLQRWLDMSKNAHPCRTDFNIKNIYPDAHEAYEVVQHDTALQEDAYRFGRVSEKAEARIGRALEGTDVREAFDERLYPAIAGRYGSTIMSGEPHYWERCSSFYGREPQHYKRLLLPLVDEAGRAGWLLSSMVWHFHEGF